MKETAWMIEKIENYMGHRWWCGGIEFTYVPNKAIRFSRKIDADRASSSMFGVFATEHIWVGDK
jgi:hypothetical protein